MVVRGVHEIGGVTGDGSDGDRVNRRGRGGVDRIQIGGVGRGSGNRDGGELGGAEDTGAEAGKIRGGTGEVRRSDDRARTVLRIDLLVLSYCERGIGDFDGDVRQAEDILHVGQAEVRDHAGERIAQHQGRGAADDAGGSAHEVFGGVGDVIPTDRRRVGVVVMALERRAQVGRERVVLGDRDAREVAQRDLGCSDDLSGVRATQRGRESSTRVDDPVGQTADAGQAEFRAGAEDLANRSGRVERNRRGSEEGAAVVRVCAVDRVERGVDLSGRVGDRVTSGQRADLGDRGGLSDGRVARQRDARGGGQQRGSGEAGRGEARRIVSDGEAERTAVGPAVGDGGLRHAEVGVDGDVGGAIDQGQIAHQAKDVERVREAVAERQGAGQRLNRRRARDSNRVLDRDAG